MIFANVFTKISNLLSSKFDFSLRPTDFADVVRQRSETSFDPNDVIAIKSLPEKNKVGRPLKLTQKQADEIRLQYNTTKATQKDLAERYGVSPATIVCILKKKNYLSQSASSKDEQFKELVGDVQVDPRIANMKFSTSKVNAGQVIEMRQKFASGLYTQDELASSYGLAKKTVSSILNHRSWKNVA